MKTVYAIEGIDRLGKSTLINSILQKEGYFQVIHFGKPVVLDCYELRAQTMLGNKAETIKYAKYLHQRECFLNSMLMTQSNASIIFDRWHLGECVYAPMYRGYSGDYVFDLELEAQLDVQTNLRLILLTEDFDRSTHFKSDGESFNDQNRREEQELFAQSFLRSNIKDKKIICVTGLNGDFRPKNDILDEALA